MFKYKGSKIALGVLLIILSFMDGFPANPFDGAESLGMFMWFAVLFLGGAYLIYKGSRNTKDDIQQL